MTRFRSYDSPQRYIDRSSPFRIALAKAGLAISSFFLTLNTLLHRILPDEPRVYRVFL